MGVIIEDITDEQPEQRTDEETAERPVPPESGAPSEAAERASAGNGGAASAAEPSDAAANAEQDDKARASQEEIPEEGPLTIAQCLLLKARANDLYKQKMFRDAIALYTRAADACPEENRAERAVFLANRAACRVSMEDWDGVVLDCTAALEADETYTKARLRRALAYESIGELHKAMEDYQGVKKDHPQDHTAHAALLRLEPVVKKKDEELKNEMMGKLKDLGNMVLGNFGLSTDNFKLNQTEGGGYNIQFVQNPGGDEEAAAPTQNQEQPSWE
ncbi:unnamed protein product [Pedinophyceae sp. YPF-701]|nr:unnamed protein product [Pedinophyceae sp. YPF-701]